MSSSVKNVLVVVLLLTLISVAPPIASAVVLAPNLLEVKPEVILKLAGSNTIGAKLAPALASDYLKRLGSIGTIKKKLENENEFQVVGFLPNENRVVAIEIKAHGSTTGFQSLIAKDSDIAMSSRGIREQENLELLLDLGDMTKPESEHIIALDGLAVIAHPDNSVKQLTVNDLAAIFSGQITNWSELGGANVAITLHARDDQSGTYDTFNSLVLKKIGQKLAELPKQFSISSEDYALSRRLFLYANKDRSHNRHVNDFIELAVSKEGQKMVELVEFVPQKITSSLAVETDDYPSKYRKIAAVGKRLSMTFRMRSDRAEIDNKSVQDIEHLVDYLSKQSHKKVTLVGFSAGESNDERADKNRAFNRSRLLAHELKVRGVRNVEIIALGNQLPIDSNGNEIGRYKNNRTEVWLIESSESS